LKHICLATFLAVVWFGPASAFELDGPVIQGALRIGMVGPGTAVTLDGKPIRVDPTNGGFVFGISRDRQKPLQIVTSNSEGQPQSFTFVVSVRDYDIERIDGLPPRKVSPNTTDLERIRREGRMILAARTRDTSLVHVFSGFRWPMTGRISGRYGNQRILNGKLRRPHLGIDIAAPQGSPVAASADGEVSLVETDLFYTGGTIVLDHGHGVTSIYSHLASVGVIVGQAVLEGERIGTVGSTGRSTGPHLDWRINWFDLRLDPELIAGPMPAGG
jgi:hypothetical protein